MTRVVEVAKGIFRIGPLDTGNDRTPNTSPHLIVGEKLAVIWEPGEPGQGSELLEAIRKIICLDLDRIAYVGASHIHQHHVSGVSELLKELPKATMVIHHRGAPHLIDPTRLNESTHEVFGEGCPPVSPVPEDRIWAVLGGEVIDLGERELEIIEALGHSPHHIALFDRLTRALFPGDTVGNFNMKAGDWHGSPEIRAPMFHVGLVVETLHRLRALKPSMLLAFSSAGVCHSPDKIMQWAEEDIKALERICHEGMKRKMTFEEIDGKVYDYYKAVGIRGPLQMEEGEEEEESGRALGGMLFGLLAYIKRYVDPSVEMPQRPQGALNLAGTIER